MVTSYKGIMVPTNPWYHAEQEGRAWINYHDVKKAVTAGATQKELWRTVLAAIAVEQVHGSDVVAAAALCGPLPGGLWPEDFPGSHCEKRSIS